jgi:hypothetical protein
MKWRLRSKHLFITLSILGFVFFLTGCNTPQASDDDSKQGNLPSQEQALSSDESSENTDPDELGLAQIKCPEDATPYKLQLNHTFDFSPNRQTDQMQVTGHTSENAWCLVNVDGIKVEAEDCIVDFDFNGFVQGDDGKCDILGSSTALISIDGECMPGVKGAEFAEIYLTITETGNPDAMGGGTLDCPNYSGPYIGFYPPSFYIATFLVTDTPDYDTDNGPDLTGQFEYQKKYTLIPTGSP